MWIRFFCNAAIRSSSSLVGIPTFGSRVITKVLEPVSRAAHEQRVECFSSPSQCASVLSQQLGSCRRCQRGAMAMASASQFSESLIYAEFLTWDSSSVSKDLSQECSAHAEVSISPDFAIEKPFRPRVSKRRGSRVVSAVWKSSADPRVSVMWYHTHIRPELHVSSGGHWFESSSSLL